MRLILAQRDKQKQAPSHHTGDYYPRSFLDYLRATNSTFFELRREHQHALAVNLWGGVGLKYAHKEHAGAFAMHWRSRRKMYGSAAAFHDLNASLAWFELVAGASIKEGLAQAWALSEPANAMLQGYFSLAATERSSDAAGLISADGTPYRLPPDGIRSRTHDGSNTKHPRKAMQAAVEVNGDALHQFHKAGEAWLLGEPAPLGFEWAHEFWDSIKNDRGKNGGEEQARARVNRALVQASAILHIAKSSSVPGFVFPMVYQEYPTGRLFAEGALNLQVCPREVRRAALLGSWDVDVSNCHWALLKQMAARLGLQSPVIDHYLANKRGIRLEIAFAGGISEKDAKQVLLGLVYGMNLQATEASRRQAIIDTVGPEAAARLRIFAPLLAIFREVKSLREHIIADYELRTTRKGFLVNDAGNAITTKATSAEKLAHVLQGAEAVILREVIREHGPTIKLLAHDGWVMATEPDKQAMEAMLLERTGYAVELEISRL